MNMKKSLGLVLGITFLFVPMLAMAQTSQTSGLPASQTVGGQVNTTPLPSASQATVQNPLNVSSFCGLIQALLTVALQIGIPIAVLFVVWAGFKFVTAQGNSTKLTDARKNMLWTVVGIGIFLGAWLIAQLVVNTINSVGGGSNSYISCSQSSL